jgi:transketolase
MVERAVQVAEQLKKTGINAGVISMHTIKPFDDSLIIQQAKQVRVLCTLEEHSVIGVREVACWCSYLNIKTQIYHINRH